MATGPDPPGDVLTPPELVEASRPVAEARQRGAAGPGGPVSEAAKAAVAAGLTFTTATTLVDRDDEEFQLPAGSPAMFRPILLERLQRCRLLAQAQRWADRAPEVTGFYVDRPDVSVL